MSFKNGLYYLAKFGYIIDVFSFLPEGFDNLCNPAEVFPENVSFHRLPRCFNFLVLLVKRIMARIGHSNSCRLKKVLLKPDESVELKEYNSFGLIFHNLLFCCVMLPIEFLRVSLAFLIKGRPNLLYGINEHGALISSIIGKVWGVKVLTRFHGTCVNEQNLARFADRVLMWFNINSLRAKSDAIVMTNDGTRGDVILKCLGVPDERISFWMNGVDTESFSLPKGKSVEALRQKHGLCNRRVLLMVSRLVAWKRVDRGISCVHALMKYHDMHDVSLVIIGEGSERIPLMTQAQSAGVSAHFVEGVSHSAVGLYMLMADIFLSLYDRSNLCNPLLEAMYFGRPIVSIADRSTDLLLEDDINSVLLPLPDITSAFSVRVANLLRDQKRMIQLGENAKTTYNEKIITWEDRMRLEDKLISDIIA